MLQISQPVLCCHRKQLAHPDHGFRLRQCTSKARGTKWLLAAKVGGLPAPTCPGWLAKIPPIASINSKMSPPPPRYIGQEQLHKSRFVANVHQTQICHLRTEALHGWHGFGSGIGAGVRRLAAPAKGTNRQLTYVHMTHRCDSFHPRMSWKGCGCVFPIGESGTKGAFRSKGYGNVSRTADKA